MFFIFVISDWLIIMTIPGHIDAGGARRELLSINGTALECWVVRSDAIKTSAPQGYVLEFCGNATRAESIARYVAYRWRKFPVETWVVNYPGVGGSAGWPRMASIPAAALGAFDAIARRAPGKPIFTEANSLGTTAALCVAARRPVAGCVLHNPVQLTHVLVARHGWWNLWLLAGPVAWRVPAELDAIENSAHATAPCVFILAEKDELMTSRQHELVTSAYAGAKRLLILKGKGHWAGVDGDANRELDDDLDWLWNGASGIEPSNKTR